MKHTYHIQGMSCNGCRSHVEETLSKVEGVTGVEVSLEKAEAVIQMEEHIPIETFEEALKNDGGGYSIHTHGHHHPSKKKEKKTVSNGNGTFYCPMQCEGDKTFLKAFTKILQCFNTITHHKKVHFYRRPTRNS